MTTLPKCLLLIGQSPTELIRGSDNGRFLFSYRKLPGEDFLARAAQAVVKKNPGGLIVFEDPEVPTDLEKLATSLGVEEEDILLFPHSKKHPGSCIQANEPLNVLIIEGMGGKYEIAHLRDPKNTQAVNSAAWFAALLN